MKNMVTKKVNSFVPTDANEEQVRNNKTDRLRLFVTRSYVSVGTRTEPEFRQSCCS